MKVEQKDPLPPPCWTDDDLTDFIQMTVENTYATFHNNKREFEIIRNIDKFYGTIIDHLLNPKDFLASMLLLRSHSAYRGACRMSLSGQVVETFVLLRSCIESSLYALHINRNPSAGEKWIKRHENEKTLKDAKNEFRYSNVINTLQLVDPSIFKTTKLLYERTIDFGGHPNERAITSMMEIIEKDGRKEIQQIYLVGNNKMLLNGLKSTAQVGLCALYILYNIFKERFDIIGITQKIDQYRSIL
jgi:hypothetical protein